MPTGEPWCDVHGQTLCDCAEAGRRVPRRQKKTTIPLLMTIDPRPDPFERPLFDAKNPLETEWKQPVFDPLPTPELNDPIEHPKHYAGNGLETIDVIEAWGLGYCLGNTVKYISRAGKKDPEKTVEDLKKANWYLCREIKRLGG